MVLSMAERTKSHCEMCGKNVGTRVYTVQGARMNLCLDCARFGSEYNDPRAASDSRPAPGSNDAIIQQRLEKREKRNQSRDIYAGTETTELRDDYGKIIGDAIRRKGLSVKEFSESISEKELTISKIISQTLTPDDKIVAKLEKNLGVKLYETVSAGSTSGKSQSGGMTLGNFLRVEKK